MSELETSKGNKEMRQKCVGISYLSYLFENYESLDFNGDVVPAYRTVIILKVLTYLFGLTNSLVTFRL